MKGNFLPLFRFVLAGTSALLFVFNLTASFAQNIAINTTGTAAASTNMLEVTQASITNNTVGLFATHTGAATNAYAIWAAVTAGTNKYALVVPSGGGSVGIGTTTPNAILDVYQSTTSTAATTLNNNYLVVTASGATANNYIGSNSQAAALGGSAYTGNIIGHWGIANYGGSGTASNAIGLYSDAGSSSSGTLSNATGVRGGIIVNSTGNITNAFHMISGYYRVGTGTVTNDYGFYHPGAPAGWVSGGGKAYSFYAANDDAYFGRRVGIGTTVPSYRLHVLNTDPANTVTILSDYQPTLTANQATNLHSAWNQININSAFNFNCDLYGAVNRINSFAGQTGTVNNTFGSVNDLWHSGTGTISSAYGTWNAIHNTAGGVVSNAYGAYHFVQNTGAGSITNGIGVGIGSIDGTNKWGIYSSDANARIYFAGKTGIGTSTPAYSFEIQTTNSRIMALIGSGNVVTATDGVTQSGVSVQAQWSPSASTTDVVGYESYVNLAPAAGITISNAYGLRVRGTKSGAGSVTRGYGVYVDMNPGFGTTKYAGIFMNGNVGIGTTTPTYLLQVNGNMYASDIYLATWGDYLSNILSWMNCGGCYSDLRFKKDIQPLSSALSNIMKMQGVNYFWKTDEFPDKHFTNGKQIGFIAQDMEKIYPELVRTDKDGFKSVDYPHLTAILAEAIKEQQKMIGTQQSAINDLQSTVGKLQSGNKVLSDKLADLESKIKTLQLQVSPEAKK